MLKVIKKHVNLFILALVITSICSCSNFLEGANLKQQLDKEIEYQNSRTAKITVSADAKQTAQIIPAAGNYYKKASDTIEMSYIANDGYEFVKWQCIPKGSVKFESETTAQTIATILNSDQDITILPSVIVTKESDKTAPVLKAFRIGVSKESVSSGSDNGLFAPNKDEITKSDIPANYVLSDKNNVDVWIYVELEDEGLLNELFIKEKLIEDCLGNSRNRVEYTNVNLESFVREGNTFTGCFKYKTQFEKFGDGIVEVSFVRAKDEAGNSVDFESVLNQESVPPINYYFIRNTVYNWDTFNKGNFGPTDSSGNGLFESWGYNYCESTTAALYNHSRKEKINDFYLVVPDVPITKYCNKAISKAVVEYCILDENSDPNNLKFTKMDMPLTGNNASGHPIRYENIKRNYSDKKEEPNLNCFIWEFTVPDSTIDDTILLKVTLTDAYNHVFSFNGIRGGAVNKVYQKNDLLFMNTGSLPFKDYNSTYIMNDYSDLNYIYYSDSAPTPVGVNGTEPRYTLSDGPSGLDLSDYYNLEKTGSLFNYSRYKITVNAKKIYDAIGNKKLKNDQWSYSYRAEEEEQGKIAFIKISTSNGFIEFPLPECGTEESAYKKSFYLPSESKYEVHLRYYYVWNYYWTNDKYAGIYDIKDSSVTFETVEKPKTITLGWKKYTGTITDELEIPVSMNDAKGEYIDVNKPELSGVSAKPEVECWIYKIDHAILNYLIYNYNYVIDEYNSATIPCGMFSPSKLFDWYVLEPEEVFTDENKLKTFNASDFDEKSTYQIPIYNLENGQYIFFFKATYTDEDGKVYEATDGFTIDKKIYSTCNISYSDTSQGNTQVNCIYDDRIPYIKPEAPPRFLKFNYCAEVCTLNSETNTWEWNVMGGSQQSFGQWNDYVRGNYIFIRPGFPSYENHFIREYASTSTKKDGTGQYVNTNFTYCFYMLYDKQNDIRVNNKYSLKNYIEGSEGLICYFDQPTLIETFVNDTDYGDDFEKWNAFTPYSDHLNTQQVQSSTKEPYSYQFPLDNIKSGQYYCAIIYYCDGTTAVTNVRRKK